MEDLAGQRRAELRQAVIELSARGLYAPAKWAAEQLNGLVDSNDDDDAPSTSGNALEHEDNVYLLAKSFFDLKVVCTTVYEIDPCMPIHNARLQSGLSGTQEGGPCASKQHRRQGNILEVLCFIPRRRKTKRVSSSCIVTFH